MRFFIVQIPYFSENLCSGRWGPSPSTVGRARQDEGGTRRRLVGDAALGGEVEALAERVAAGVAVVPGVRAIALGGSFARGNADEASDLDVGIYYRRGELDLESLRSVAEQLDPAGGREAVTAPGDWGPWIDGGAWLTVGGRRVDLLYRDVERVQSVIGECLAGRFTSDYQPGHPHAFHSHTYLAEVALGRVLRDLDGALAALKAKATPYPPRLRTAIVDRFLWEARFALDSVAKPAQRGETWYAAGALFRSVACLVQVLFALNARYFLNEKGALREVETFDLRPARFAEIANTAFGMLGPPPEQRAATAAEIGALVESVAALAAAAEAPARSV